MNEREDKEKRAQQRDNSKIYINLPVEFLIKHNITPNKISFIGFICSLVASFLIAIGWMYYSIWLAWLIPCTLGVGGAFDLFDGEVARRTDQETQSGAFLDSNLDRLSDAIFILGLIYGGLVNYLLGYILLFLVLMISYTRSRGENEGVNMKGIGIMERADRIMFFIFTIIIELIFYFISFLLLNDPITILVPFITRVPVTPVFLIGIIVFISTLIYTVLQRLSFVFKTLNANKEGV